MKKTISLSIISFFLLLICISNANASSLPSPVSFNADVAAPSFSMTAVGGQTLSSSDYGAGKNLLLVYGRTSCGNTRAFLSGIQEGMDELAANGITVLVGLHDNPSDAEMGAFADTYPGIVCAKVSDSFSESGMWTGLNAVGYDISSGVTFPVVFLRSSDAKLRYCSTDYVNEPLKIASAAIVMSGGNVSQNPAGGSCGNKAFWSYQDGTLTISGSGTIDDYTPYDQPWNNYIGEIETIIIEEGITYIGDFAFYEHSVTNVSLPQTLTSIGDSAFAQCDALISISLPQALQSIGARAFSLCSSLPSITIPDSVTTIGSGAFYWCNSLSGINIPSSVKIIGDDTFFGCYLSSINVASGNTIYASADGVLFNKDKTDLIAFPQAKTGSYMVPRGVESISSHAFSYCFISRVILPDTVKSIEEFAFYECEPLTGITIPLSVTYIGDDAFAYCYELTISCYDHSAAHNYAKENNISFLLLIGGKCGDNVFWNYQDGTMTISGTGAMYDYENSNEQPWKDSDDIISSVVVESGITRIGTRAFEYMYNLTSVSLPQTIQSIGDFAFDQSGIADIWIPRGVTSIGNQAFSFCNYLTNINIPSTVTDIGNYAFYGCEHLASIAVAAANEKFHSVDGVLFDEWSVLCFPAGKVCAEYTIPDTVSWISRTAFSFSKVNSVRVPDSVRLIFNYAFSYTSNLSVTIPKSVTYMGDGVFAESDNVTVYCFEESAAHTYCIDNNIDYVLIDTPLNNPDFVVPSALKTIESEAFSGIAAKRVKLAEGVQVIGTKAFAYCKNLASIYIPSSCTSIATDAFTGVSGMTIFGYSGTYAQAYAGEHGFVFVAVSE